jgi:hypothetical protein
MYIVPPVLSVTFDAVLWAEVVDGARRAMWRNGLADVLTQGHEALIDTDPCVRRDAEPEFCFGLFGCRRGNELPTIADPVHMDVDTDCRNTVTYL